MSRRYLAYLLWRGGRQPEGYLPTYSDISFWLEEGTPAVGRVDVEVVHHHTHQVIRSR
jgi:hypothetical protein